MLGLIPARAHRRVNIPMPSPTWIRIWRSRRLTLGERVGHWASGYSRIIHIRADHPSPEGSTSASRRCRNNRSDAFSDSASARRYASAASS